METNHNRSDYRPDLNDNLQGGQSKEGKHADISSRYGSERISARDFSKPFPESGVIRDQTNLHSQRGPEGYRRSDERLREIITDILADQPDLDASDFEVRVHEATVTVRGYVVDQESKKRVTEVIDRIPGIRNINDELRLNPHAKDID